MDRGQNEKVEREQIHYPSLRYGEKNYDILPFTERMDGLTPMQLSVIQHRPTLLRKLMNEVYGENPIEYTTNADWKTFFRDVMPNLSKRTFWLMVITEKDKMSWKKGAEVVWGAIEPKASWGGFITTIWVGSGWYTLPSNEDKAIKMDRDWYERIKKVGGEITDYTPKIGIHTPLVFSKLWEDLLLDGRAEWLSNRFNLNSFREVVRLQEYWDTAFADLDRLYDVQLFVLQDSSPLGLLNWFGDLQSNLTWEGA